MEISPFSPLLKISPSSVYHFAWHCYLPFVTPLPVTDIATTMWHRQNWKTFCRPIQRWPRASCLASRSPLSRSSYPRSSSWGTTLGASLRRTSKFLSTGKWTQTTRRSGVGFCSERVFPGTHLGSCCAERWDCGPKKRQLKRRCEFKVVTGVVHSYKMIKCIHFHARLRLFLGSCLCLKTRGAKRKA